METIKQQKNSKKKGRKTAMLAGTVCSAVMLLSGGAMFAGCGDNQPTAKNGLSAYEIAVKYGYEGTEEQWVRDLQGLQGEQGPRGDDGRSAYEIAKDRGYNGTEADWVNSISGAEGVGVQSVSTETDKWGIKTKFIFTLTNASTIEAFTTVVDPLRDYVADNTQDIALLESYGVKSEHIKMSTEGTYSASTTEDLVALVNAGVDLTDPNVEIDTTKTYAASSIEELAALNNVVQSTSLPAANISTDSATFEADSVADLQLLSQYDVNAAQVNIDTTKQYAAADTDTVLLAMNYNVPAANVDVNKEEFYNVGTAQLGTSTVADEVVTKLIDAGVEKIKLTDNIELSADFQIPTGTTIQNSANLASKYAIEQPESYKTNVTFDLNGKTLSINSASCLIVNKDVCASFVNGTISLMAADELDSTMSVLDGGKLVLKDVTYTSTGTNVQVFGQAVLDVQNSTLNGKTYCVATDDADIKNAGANVFLKDSTLNANGVDNDDTAMFIGLPTYVVMDGCTVNANRQAMIVRGGDVEIKDSTITTTATHAKKTDYRDGAWATGNEVPMAAIVLGDRYTASNGTYAANLVLTNTSVVSNDATVPTIYAWGKSDQYKATITLNVVGETFDPDGFGIADAMFNENVIVNQAVSVWDGTAGELPTAVSNTYSITSAKQLAAVASAVNAGNTFEGKTIVLKIDIDLNNLAWTPIGYGSCDHNNFDSNQSGPRFMGTFDGQNHTIYNLSITNFTDGGEQSGAAGGIGLFGQVVNGTIQNVNIDGAEINGNHYVGALAGFVLYSTIDNCAVTDAEISCTFENSDDSGDKAGAVVGYIAGDNGVATITNCSATNSTVNADRDAGQVIGCAHAVTQTGNSATNVAVTCNNTSGTEKSGQNINNDVVGRLV